MVRFCLVLEKCHAERSTNLHLPTAGNHSCHFKVIYYVCNYLTLRSANMACNTKCQTLSRPALSSTLPINVKLLERWPSSKRTQATVNKHMFPKCYDFLWNHANATAALLWIHIGEVEYQVMHATCGESYFKRKQKRVVIRIRHSRLGEEWGVEVWSEDVVEKFRVRPLFRL